MRLKLLLDLVNNILGADHVDVPSGREMPGYYLRDDERAPHRAIRDTESINASYDRYLRSGVLLHGHCYMCFPGFEFRL